MYRPHIFMRRFGLGASQANSANLFIRDSSSQDSQFISAIHPMLCAKNWLLGQSFPSSNAPAHHHWAPAAISIRETQGIDLVAPQDFDVRPWMSTETPDGFNMFQSFSLP